MKTQTCKNVTLVREAPSLPDITSAFDFYPQAVVFKSNIQTCNTHRDLKFHFVNN